MMYTYKEISFINKKKNELLIHSITWMNTKTFYSMKEARYKRYKNNTISGTLCNILEFYIQNFIKIF